MLKHAGYTFYSEDDVRKAREAGTKVDGSPLSTTRLRKGDRVIVVFLHAKGWFPGVLLEEPYGGTECAPVSTVKLDVQEQPVSGVLCYDEVPGIIESARWQYCYPEALGPGDAPA